MSIFRNLYFNLLKKSKRLKLKNHNFTIISNNCCGGVIYNSLGERFNSPTINLAFIEPRDFLTFVTNLEECLNADVTDITTQANQKYPVGQISLYEDRTISIHFMHYKTFSQAKLKWDERKQRINRNNLFVFMEAGIQTTDELVEEFDKLPYENKVIITNKPYPQYKSAYFIDIYDETYSWGKLITYVPKTLKTKRYLDKFNYIKWLNGKK